MSETCTHYQTGRFEGTASASYAPCPWCQIDNLLAAHSALSASNAILNSHCNALSQRVAEMEAEIAGWREGMSEAIDDLRSAGRTKAADMYHNVYFATADPGSPK